MRLRIQTFVRTDFYPHEEESLGRRLAELLWERMGPGKQPPRPSLFLFQADLVQVVDLVPILKAGMNVQRAIASFASLEGVDAMALVAMLDRKGPNGVETVGGVFLEQSDGRWWMASRVRDGSQEKVWRAVEGAAKPRGLGGWFSAARFLGLKIRLEPVGEELLQ